MFTGAEMSRCLIRGIRVLAVAAIIARSDERDARPVDDVAAEVARRSGPIPEREPQAQGEVEGAAKGAHT